MPTYVAKGPVIPYQFTKVLHIIPSELDKIRCVGSPGSHMYPKGNIWYGFPEMGS